MSCWILSMYSCWKASINDSMPSLAAEEAEESAIANNVAVVDTNPNEVAGGNNATCWRRGVADNEQTP